MGGGGESAEATFRAMKSYLLGHDPARMEEMRFKLATASLYNNRTQILAALEFASLGKKWNASVCDCYEDPCFGINALRRVREMVRIQTATNTVVVGFEQLSANILDRAVDVSCSTRRSGAASASASKPPACATRF